jgi:hypothetical protein
VVKVVRVLRQFVEPIALVVGQPKPQLVELALLAEEELVPVELAFVGSQLVVETAKELDNLNHNLCKILVLLKIN